MKIEKLVPDKKYFRLDGFDVIWFKFICPHQFKLGLSVLDYQGKAMFVKNTDLEDWQIFNNDIEALKVVVEKLRKKADYIDKLINTSENEN